MNFHFSRCCFSANRRNMHAKGSSRGEKRPAGGEEGTCEKWGVDFVMNSERLRGEDSLWEKFPFHPIDVTCIDANRTQIEWTKGGGRECSPSVRHLQPRNSESGLECSSLAPVNYAKSLCNCIIENADWIVSHKHIRRGLNASPDSEIFLNNLCSIVCWLCLLTWDWKRKLRLKC